MDARLTRNLAEYHRNYQKSARGRASLTKASHKYRGVELLASTVEIANLLIDTTQCRYCGTHFVSQKRGLHDSNQSVDIVDPAKPTVISNLQVICLRCNQMKRKLPHVVFVDLCSEIATRNLSQ